MFKLSTGYLISGVITGILLIFSFLTSLPDGKLHLVFCNVGQGDAAYIRFPDGKDMLIDGGPGTSVLSCLGRHMPFWDRTIDIVALSHPEKDHLDGLLAVLERYKVNYFFRSDVSKDTEVFAKLIGLIQNHHIPEKLFTTGQNIRIGNASLAVLWPTQTQITLMKPLVSVQLLALNNQAENTVLGASTGNVNDGSLVIKLSYGTFDALFPGDADSHVDPDLIAQIPFDSDNLEVVKVPHHGSKTGMTDSLLSLLSPQAVIRQKCLNLSRDNNQSSNNPELSTENILSSSNPKPRTVDQSNCPIAIISVGKNSYGHPAREVIDKLQNSGFGVLRTDELGDIEVVSDGNNWTVKN
jgi:competence protein ComEC